MKLQLADLQAAFRVVDSVESNAALESSQFVRLRRSGNSLAMTLTGTLWAEASITSKDTGKWTVHIDRRILKAFLATASGTEVDLFFAKDSLTIKAAQRLEIAAHAPISGYETWNPKTTFDLPDDQKQILKTALKYLPKMPGTENVDAVNFIKSYGVLVTDTLFMMAVMGTKVTANFYLPPGVAAVMAEQSGKIATDTNGIGIVLLAGFAYQPLSADLDNYPKDKCLAAIEEALKSPTLATVKAADLLNALNAASQFLLDKAASAKITALTGLVTGIQLTVDLAAGNFQRMIPSTGACKVTGDITWPLRNIVPFVEYVVAVNSAAELEYKKLSNASAFCHKEGAVTRVLLFADL